MDLDLDVKTFLKLNLVKYLNQRNFIDVINERVLEHVNRIDSGEIDVHHTFYLNVPIDLLYLFDFSPYIGHLLVLEPNLIRDAIHEILKMCLQQSLPSKIKVQDNQIICQLVITPIADMLHPYPAPGLCAVRGVVVAQTLPKKIVRSSRWKCNASICVNLDPVIAKGLPAKSPLCNHCAGPLDEVTAMRTYSAKVTAKISEIAASHYRNPGIFQYTSICVIDDKGVGEEEFCLGEEINCWGVRKYDSMLVWGWHKKNPPPILITPTSNIEMLRRQLGTSPWSFVQALAGCIGGRLFPPNMLMHLRTGLLLSLASLNSSQPISILATNNDTALSEKLMIDATRAAPICCLHSFSSCLGGYVEDDTWYAGTMLRASKGVTYLGEWYPYLEKKGAPVRNAVESGRVVLERGTGEYLPLKSAIWTFKNSPKSKKEFEQQETLLKIFGLNWTTSVDSDTEDEIIMCLIEQNTLEPLVSMEELNEYIEAINTRPVQLSDGALELLKQYFVCARRIRDKELPLRSLDLLIVMTEAHARLNQRPLAFPEDAIATIYLCEQSMGPSYTTPKPPEEIGQFCAWLQENVLTVI